jgi:hypothetical protein
MKALARLAVVLAIGIAAGSPAGAAKPTASVNPMDASVWEIGPITPNGNRSVNMPPTPSPHPDGWYFDFPQPDSTAGHVHYLTFKHGSLSGKSPSFATGSRPTRACISTRPDIPECSRC